MTSERDIERLLDRWFTERSTDVADRVLDEVADRIGRQPQQRAWRVLRRDTHVNSYLKPLIAVAAVIVIAVAGIAYFAQPSEPGAGGAVPPTPSPSPTASASPSAVPSAAAVLPPWFTPESGSNGAGILPAGSHTTQSFAPGSTFRLPEGWVNDIDTNEFFGLFPDTPANEAAFARSGHPGQVIFMGFVDTPALGVCDGVGDTHGSTSAELVESLVADEGLVTSEPVEVTMGDLTGLRVDAHLDPDWTESCKPNSDDPPTKEDKDRRGRFVFLDIPGGGKLLMIIDSATSAGFEPLLAEAMPIVESFDFNLEP
jgi:hypothetical protein